MPQCPSMIAIACSGQAADGALPSWSSESTARSGIGVTLPRTDQICNDILRESDESCNDLGGGPA
jgi:hypothetical protein